MSIANFSKTQLAPPDLRVMVAWDRVSAGAGTCEKATKIEGFQGGI